MSNYWKKKLEELNEQTSKTPSKKTSSSDYWGSKLTELEEANKQKEEDIAPVQSTTKGSSIMTRSTPKSLLTAVEDTAAKKKAGLIGSNSEQSTDWNSVYSEALKLQENERSARIGLASKKGKAYYTQKAKVDSAKEELNTYLNKYGFKSFNELKTKTDTYNSQKEFEQKTNNLYEKYGSILSAADYSKHSGASGSKQKDVGWKFWQDKGDDLYDFINDINGYRTTVEAISAGTAQKEKYGTYTKYSFLTDEEKGIYNYIYAKQGKEKADEYLEDLDAYLEARYGADKAENAGTVQKALYWLPSGIENWSQGVKQFFTEENLPETSTQVASGIIKEEAYETSPILGNLYSVGEVVSNQIPNILLTKGAGTAASAFGAGAKTVNAVSKVAGATGMFLSAGGNAYGQALDWGKSEEEARTYGTIVGALEAGLQTAIGGISSLGGVSDAAIMGKVALIENTALRMVSKYGLQVGAEITEEELQLWAEPLVRTMVFGDEYDAPEIEEMLETAIVTAISTGVLNSTSNIKDGTKVNGIGTNEAKVINTEIENRIKEREASGEKLTTKEKNKIRQSVVEDLEKGYISTDTIEEVLGGENYTSYKSAVDKENALQSEFDTLNKMKQGEMTGEQVDRREELRRQLADLKATTNTADMKTKLGDEVFSLVKDSKLAESYNERARRGQAFEVDLTQYEEKYQPTIKKAVESGILNNTRRTHEFVDFVSKISADKGVLFDFTSNENLKNSSYAVDGKTVNGFVDESGNIVLNINSAKSLNSTAGHEITHILEGTELYQPLSDIITEYAKTKGEYDSRLASLNKLYEGVYKGEDFDAKVRKELVADLVGDYIFTDKAFVQKLSTENRNIFQKIYDEIKYLCKVATAGSKEARELEKVKKTFAEVYRESGKAQKSTAENSGVKYSLSRDEVRSWNIAWDSNDYSTLKEQLREHIDEINKMQPVATVVYNKQSSKPYYKVLDELLRDNFGYKIQRKEYGTITFDSGTIEGVRNYINNDAEAAAIISAPYVLKRGKAITGHKNHKGKENVSVTFAAPVVLNKQIGNVAVCVMYGKGQVHSLRVLTPEGKTFELLKIEDTESTITGHSAKAMAEPHIDPVSDNSIHNPNEDVKQKEVFGFKVNENADVNEDLLEELSIYHPEAEVDNKGNITVYHRTSKENADKIRKSGIMTANEDALYFSSKESGYASDYGDTVISFKIPSTELRVNDIFEGEVHFDLPLKYKNGAFSLDVSRYLTESNDNGPDKLSIKKSLSEQGEIPIKNGNYNIYGNDVKLETEPTENTEDIAPVKESASLTESIKTESTDAKTDLEKAVADYVEINIETIENDLDNEVLSREPKNIFAGTRKGYVRRLSNGIYESGTFGEGSGIVMNENVIRTDSLEEAISAQYKYMLENSDGDISRTIQKHVNNYDNAHNATVENIAPVTENIAGKTYISMENFANQEGSVWNNVDFNDDATKKSIMQETHNNMVSEGSVVVVSDEVLTNVEQSFPDLRTIKKKERTPILKEAMNKLKNNIRQFLNGFKNQSFEFEVNGKVLEAKLYNTGINEVLEKVTQEKANMLYSTEDIFKNARYLYSTPDYDGDPNVYRWNYFYTPVQIGENVVGVRIAVRDLAKQGESQIYNWGIKKDTSLDGVRDDSLNRESHDVSSDVSAYSISDIAPVVNTEDVAESATTTDSSDIAPIVNKQDISAIETAEENSEVDSNSKTPKATRLADGTRGNELLNKSLDNYPMQTVEQKVVENIRAVEGELADNRDLRKEAEANYNEQIANLQKQYNAKKNKNTKTAYNLLQSISRLERLKASADSKFAKRISDLEARAEKMKDPTYSRALYKQAKMQEHAKWAEDLIGDTSTWVDKKLGLQYSTNTERRNLRDIIRDENGNNDIARADAINDALNGEYNRNEAEKNRTIAKVSKPFAEMKITEAETTYIQMLGELRHNPDTTLTEKVVNEYYEKNKDKIDTAKVDKAIEEGRKAYDTAFDLLNAKLREQGMKEIPYRKGYFLHYTEPKQNFIQKLLNLKTQENEIPTSIVGLTEDFKPVKSWQPFDKQRHTDTTDYNFLKGLDNYLQGAYDWIYHLEDIQKRRAVENHIRSTHSDEGIRARIKEVYANEELDANEAQAQIEHILAEAKNPLNNFVQDFTTHTNILAGKKNSLDRAVEQLTNRHIYSVMTNVQNRMSANMVLANVRSALTNFIPIIQSWAQVSPMQSLQATKDTIANAIKGDGIIDKSTFLTNRLKTPDKLYNTAWDKVLDKAGIMFEIVDNFSSQVIWRSKYNQNLAKGMNESEAIKNADQFAENVMAGRSKGNEPTLFNAKNPLVKAFTMFQLEVNNQYGYLFKDVPNDLKAETNHWKFNLAKGYTTAFVGAYVYNSLMEQVAGSGAALDPIGIIEDLLRDLGLFDDDEEKEGAEVVTNLVDNVVEELPFVGGLFGGGRIPISSALPYSDDGIKGAIEDVSEGNWGNVGKEMMNPLLNIGLPVGGGQIKKTTQGLSMFNINEDRPVAGSYTDSGALRFPVEDTIGNRIQAGIFGQYANENAREYFDNDYAPLKEKEIQEYKDVDIPIKDYWEYREGLKGLETTEEKFDYIDSLDLPLAKKNILANNVSNREEYVDLNNYDDFSSLEEFDFATHYPEKYAVAKSVGGYTAYKTYSSELYDIKADKDNNGKAISGSRKEKVVDYINNLNIDYYEKIILFKNEYKADNTYNYEIIDYLNSREDISYAEMEAILKELGFTVLSDGTIRW